MVTPLQFWGLLDEVLIMLVRSYWRGRCSCETLTPNLDRLLLLKTSWHFSQEQRCEPWCPGQIPAWVIKFCSPKIPPVVPAESRIPHFLHESAAQNCFVPVNSCHSSPQRNCCSSLLNLSLSLPLTHGGHSIAPEHPSSLAVWDAGIVQGTSKPGPHSPR